MAKKLVKKNSAASTPVDVDNLFANAEVQERRTNLPNGTYQGFVVPGSAKVEERTSRAGNTAWLASMRLKVLSGEYANREQSYFQNLGSDVGVNIFVTDLAAMGFAKPASLREAADCMAETDGLKVSFWVRNKDDGYAPDVRINDLLEDDDIEPSDEAPEEIETNDSQDEPQLTAKEVKALGKADDEEALQEIIDDYGLDIDQDEYDTYAEVASVIIEQLEL